MLSSYWKKTAGDDDDDDSNNNKKLLIDVAVPSDRNVIQKKAEKKLKYENIRI
jgi:hypothetical protein